MGNRCDAAALVDAWSSALDTRDEQRWCELVAPGARFEVDLGGTSLDLSPAEFWLHAVAGVDLAVYAVKAAVAQDGWLIASFVSTRMYDTVTILMSGIDHLEYDDHGVVVAARRQYVPQLTSHII